MKQFFSFFILFNCSAYFNFKFISSVFFLLRITFFFPFLFWMSTNRPLSPLVNQQQLEWNLFCDLPKHSTEFHTNWSTFKTSHDLSSVAIVTRSTHLNAYVHAAVCFFHYICRWFLSVKWKILASPITTSFRAHCTVRLTISHHFTPHTLNCAFHRSYAVSTLNTCGHNKHICMCGCMLMYS